MDRKKQRGRSPLATAKNISAPPASSQMGNDSSESQAAVDNFNAMAQGGAGPSQKEQKKKSAVEQAQEQSGQDFESLSGQDPTSQFLNQEQLTDFLNLQQRWQTQQLVMLTEGARMEHMKQALERAQQIEERLEPPRLIDFLSKGWITQEVPIVNDPETGQHLVVTFRSIPPRVDRILKELIIQELKTWEFAKLDRQTVDGVEQMFRLSVVLERINGQNFLPHPPTDIYNVIQENGEQWRERASKMILANFAKIDMWESSFIIQMIGQFEAFVLRCRRLLDTVGLAKTVGN